MRSHEYSGRKLETPSYKHDMWLQCCVLEGETEVPQEYRRDFCGLWFHSSCIGVLREPKGKKESERVACLLCLQDKRFRPKVPATEQISMLAVWDRLGVPRILANEKDGRLPTLRLGCDCQLAVGQGLPCEGQLAVSRCVGGVISFHSYNRHFFSHKLLELDIPPPVFRSNQSVVLNVDAVINHREKEAAPSKIPDAMAPQLAEVVLPEEVDDEVIPSLVMTVDGVANAAVTTLADVEDGGAKSTSKRSRRYRSKKKN
jgi:hypothetical protein